MKNTLSLLVGALLLCATAFAQKPPIKFGDIPMEDMKMIVYPLDSGAEAVVLADYGESALEYNKQYGFQITFERTKRIKILKKEGLRFAELAIPLWHDDVNNNDETLSGLRLVTYNLENGKIVETKVKGDSFFKEKFNKNLNLMKVAWTNVKEGSVIEITYKMKSDFVFNFQDWEFQSTIPVRWSEYRARIPEYYTYQKFMQGYVALVLNENKTRTNTLTVETVTQGRALINPRFGETVREKQTSTVEYSEESFRWAAKDVPAFRKEPYMTTASDYMSKINFELAYTNFPQSGIKNYMGNWEDISTAYWTSAKDEINGNAGLKDDVERLLAGSTGDEAKAAAILNHIKQNVLWDETSGRYADNTPRKTMDLKKGSSAEINILLACMLDKAGIAVNPVLLSTRDHGFVRETIPLSTQFNYVVCLVKLGSKEVLLDATDRLLPFGVLPERCLNGQGLVVSDGSSRWISLQPTIKSRTIYSVDVALTETGEIKGILKVDNAGYNSVRARRQYHLKGEKEYLKEYVTDALWTISNSEFQNASDINLPFKENHQFSVNEVATASSSTIYFNPFVVGREEENPFKAETREYPVDFGNSFEEMYMAKIVIPEGYIVEELPASKAINMPEGAARYVYNLTSSGNTINLTSGLYINRSLYTQDIYTNLREFYNQVVAKQAEQIVLKKK